MSHLDPAEMDAMYPERNGSSTPRVRISELSTLGGRLGALSIKPPVGLMPRSCSDNHRMADILGAMSRYSQAGLRIPMSWIDEMIEINLRVPE